MTPNAFQTIAELVKARSGLLLTPKGYMLQVRLAPILQREGLASLDALALRLRHPSAEPLLRDVTEALATHEFLLFRDGRPFEHLRRAIPALLARRPPQAGLRLWSAACSTGQEAYSAAMILADLNLAGRPIEILGTDIARDVLDRARHGSFTQFEVQRGLPIQLLIRHFAQDGMLWRISPALRAMTRFVAANLLDDCRALGRFDVIFCRNVLIYFDLPTKARVLSAVMRQLAPDGILYLGGAETPLGLTEGLAAIPGERGAYRLDAEAALAS